MQDVLAPSEKLNWHPRFNVKKYSQEYLLTHGGYDLYEKVENGLGGDPLLAILEPEDVFYGEGNLLLNAGITRMLNLCIGAGGQVWNNANCRIGVGNSATAAAATQTDLQGASKYFKLAAATYPQVSAQTMTMQSVFGTSVANYAWEEWVIDQGTGDGTTVVATAWNRAVASMGTKASGATWTFTVTITIS